VTAIDAKFSDPKNLERYREYVRWLARSPRSDPGSVADTAINEVYLGLRDRLDRAESPDDLGPDWPNDTYIYRALRNAWRDEWRGARPWDQLPDDMAGPDDVDDAFDKLWILQHANELVNSLEYVDEIRAQAIYVVRRVLQDVEGVVLPITIEAPTDYDQCLYEALAYTDLNLLGPPLDEDDLRKQMYRDKRRLKRRLEPFRERMEEYLSDQWTRKTSRHQGDSDT
jgi:hypothetical protein